VTATAVEILPCPFCGGEATLQGKEGARHWYVICEDSEECDASGPDKTTREEAIAAWNIRSRYRPSRDVLAKILYPEALHDQLTDTAAHLAAAISLLERTPKAKKAAPSDKMFEQMLDDYRNSLERARALLNSEDKS